MGAGGIQGRGMWQLRRPPACVSLIPVSPIPLCPSSLFSSSSLFEAVPISGSDQSFTLPFFYLPLSPQPLLPGPKEKSSRERGDNREKGFMDRLGNEVSCTEEQMGGGCGGQGLVKHQQEEFERKCVRRLPRVPWVWASGEKNYVRKGFKGWVQRHTPVI